MSPPADTGSNRVLIGLPDRLDKAKRQVILLEKRQEMIRNAINQYGVERAAIAFAVIEAILKGDFDASE